MRRSILVVMAIATLALPPAADARLKSSQPPTADGWLSSGTKTPGPTGPPTTLERTLGDFDGDNRLEAGAGEPYLLREELGQVVPGRAGRRSLLAHLAQLTDFQTVDEESPMRYEDFDDLGLGDDLLGGAYRPQEALGIHAARAMVYTLSQIRSPISGSMPKLALLTGDNADNMQENETEWYIDVLDGRPIDPDSGDPSYDPGLLCFPSLYPDDAYQGVRGDDWYEPDGSGDGSGYSSSESQNASSVGRHVAVRDFPGLFDAAQQPFASAGLGYPWVTVFGNHDALVQGNFVRDSGFESQATDCYKSFGGFFDEVVQPDPRRNLLDHGEWIAKHFEHQTPGIQPGHGFDQSAPDQGYYTLRLREDLRLIGLDSVNYDGLAGGTIRDPQFDWLDEQLELAAQRGEKAIVIAHHSLRTMNNVDWLGYEDQHCGLIEQDGETPGAPQCESLGNESLEALFYRRGNVVAYIAGHEHENNVEARSQSGGPGRFWEVTTASEVDWPQQSSLIEIFDNRDGTISIFRTLVDHMAPIDPGTNPSLSDPMTLASIAREIGFNDYQGRNGEDGTLDRRGEARDRNVELVLDLGGR